MSQIETLGLLEEIQALVSDKLQVVSYKWLSRNFLVSSHAAKRLLAKFAEKYGSGIEVVYTLSGWTKGSSPSYLVKLVPGPKLDEAKQEYDGNCSVQVYSVQACIPNDPAVIWNAEFLQAENLFMQPSDVDNCLRDNRFCSILNPTVHRSINGATVLDTTVQPKSEEVSGALLPSKKDTKGTNVGGVSDEITKPIADKEKVPSFTSVKQKEPSVKSSSAAGGSLANLWGRASVKSKPSDSVKNDVSADAQISSREALEEGSSDDNDQDVSYQRLSSSERNRKRKVVFDMSDDDECEEAVKLPSPSLPTPRMQPGLDAKQSSGPFLKKANLIDDPLKAKKLKETGAKVKDEPRDEQKVHLQPKEDKPKLKEERTADKEINQTSTVEASAVNGGKAPTSMVESLAPETDPNTDNVAAASRSSPQRKKVLKTRIDERGREVTEVVWEGRDMEVKKAESVTKSNHDTNATASMTSSRPAATKKSPALGGTNAGGKTGNKKVQGGKGPNPKQGNILSYFKAK